uniref:C-C motif chemokine 3-like n=1 Tax=Taeniopygia guttata TaxID=59729 RepID=A0A674GCB1_TAEGU
MVGSPSPGESPIPTVRPSCPWRRLGADGIPSAGTKPQRWRFSGAVPRGHSTGDGKPPGSHRQSLCRSVGSHWAHLSSLTEDKTMCCFSYISRRIPRSVISSAYITSNTCSMPAVVLITRQGKKICADPKADWVQKHLKHLERLEH